MTEKETGEQVSAPPSQWRRWRGKKPASMGYPQHLRPEKMESKNNGITQGMFPKGKHLQGSSYKGKIYIYMYKYT